MSRTSPDSLSERDRRELTALADGSLTGRRRKAAEARIAGSPTLRAGLERQRRAVAALTGAEVAVPASLRARVRGAIEEPPKGRTPWLAWAGGATNVDELLVYSSETDRDGPVYTVIGRASLTGKPTGKPT